MNEELDTAWEDKRLRLLESQCFCGEDVEGKVVFICEDNQQTYITASAWNFSDADCKQISDSGYQYFCYRLLDDFIAYRAMFKGLEFRGGILSLKKGKATIKWLPLLDATKEIKVERRLIEAQSVE